MTFSLKTWQRWALALLIGLLGLVLRLDAAVRLPIDADEDTYLNNAMHYAWSIRQGNWKQIYKYDQVEQHPILNRLAYAAALLTVDPAEKLQPKDIPRVPVMQTPGALWIVAARRMAAVLGALGVFVLALLNPAAGLLLAFHTSAIKFTSEVYIEALPMLTSLLAMISYDRWQKGEFGPSPAARSNLLWLAASAVFLGMTAAGKYIYCLAGLAILLDFALRCWQQRESTRGREGTRGRESTRGSANARRVGWMLAWGAAALAAFLLFNLILWIHTAQRLRNSVLFHLNYSQSWDVKGSYRFWWYPLYLLVRSTPDEYPRLRGIFPLEPDLWITLLALPGVLLLWRRARPYALWLGVALAFLLLWSTKWDQYLLVVIPPLCLAAGETLTWAARRSRRLLARKVP